MTNKELRDDIIKNELSVKYYHLHYDKLCSRRKKAIDDLLKLRKK